MRRGTSLRSSPNEVRSRVTDGQAAADASRGSPSGLPALTVGADPDTLP